MGLRLKFNLVLLLVFAVGLGVTGYISYDLLHRNAREEVMRNAGIMVCPRGKAATRDRLVRLQNEKRTIER